MPPMIIRFKSAGVAGLVALCAALPLPALADLEVRVDGLSGAEQDNVESRLGILAAADREDLSDDQVRSLHQQAVGDIRKALQPYGYYEPVIESTLDGQAPDWRANYRIAAGPRTLISKVDVVVEGEAREFEAVVAVMRQLRLREGDPLLHERYEDAKSRLQQAAYNNGYLDAVFTRAELRVKPTAHTAEILLTLDSGPRYFFGDITLETQGLDETFVRNYVLMVPGEPFDPQQLLKTQFALSDLDYFQTVEMAPLRESMRGNRIPVEIRTTPRPRRRYEIGAGYGTDTGARLTSAIEFRRLGDTGHKLRGEARVSEIKDSYGGEYRIPLGRKPGENLSFTGTRAYEKFVDGGESLKYALGASLARVPGKWQRRLYLQYEHEESVIADVSDISDLLIPGLSLNRSETDNPIHTRRGWSAFADVHGAYKEALSSTSFLQVRGLLRTALPLFERARLLGRAELGVNLVEAFSKLPPSQRFFAGGDQSVRGYAYQSLGPRDASGRVIGGQYLSAFSIEAEYSFSGRLWNGLLRNWGAAAFVDAGGADDIPWPELARGIGAGLRYRAPIGFVNLDLAHALDGDDRRGLRLHISVRVGL